MEINDLERLRGVLHSRKYKISVAESLTGGILQDLIVGMSGASTFFEGGVTTYSIEQKCKLLSVDYEQAKSVNCVSSIVAAQMSKGVCEMFNTDVGIATTGYSEPSSELGVKHPFAFVSICIKGELKIMRIEAKGLERNEARKFIANKAIDLCLESLKDL